MTDIRARYQRLEPLIDRALELDETARDRFLALCAEIHPDLIADLRRALASDDDLPNLGQLAAEITSERPTDRRGLRAGAWQLLEKIGQGGMGTVYLAERADGSFDKRVAIKLLRGEDPRFKEQLERERRMLARLDHPGIARLIDGGVMPDGQPWLVMELADGEDLDVWLRRTKPSLRQRLEVFITICKAVSYAHGELVVHRDLKPGNIRVTSDDGVKLLDFGIAKLLSPDASAGSTRHIALTPEFAAPEQLLGSAVTVRTDVYALGTLLYLLLAGRSPHPRFDGNWAGYIEHITQVDAVAASDTAAAADPGGVALAAAQLRGDLDAILVKALAREPGQRYASVDSLAQDVRRYLLDRPVLARTATWQYRSGKWLRRNWGIAGLLGGIIVTLGGGIVAMEWQAQGLVTERDAAHLELSRSRAVGSNLAAVLRRLGAAPKGAEAQEQRATMIAALDEIHQQNEGGPEARQQMLLTLAGAFLDAGDDEVAGQVLSRFQTRSDAAGLQAQAHIYRASLASRRGQQQEADMEMVAGLNLLQVPSGQNSRDLAMVHPALLRYFAGATEPAAALLQTERAYALYAEYLSPGDAKRLELRMVMAQLLARHGLQDAARLNLDAVVDRLDSGGPTVRNLLATALCERGIMSRRRAQSALADAQRCVEIRRAALGENHWETLEAVALYASLQEQGKMSVGAKQAVAALQSTLGPNHPRVQRAQGWFAPE